MRDARNYARPLEFHGFRHVDAATLLAANNTGSFESPEPEKASPITDINDWQIWGTGRMAWYDLLLYLTPALVLRVLHWLLFYVLYCDLTC
jgi:hypothetical protein